MSNPSNNANNRNNPQRKPTDPPRDDEFANEIYMKRTQPTYPPDYAPPQGQATHPPVNRSLPAPSQFQPYTPGAMPQNPNRANSQASNQATTQQQQQAQSPFSGAGSPIGSPEPLTEQQRIDAMFRFETRSPEDHERLQRIARRQEEWRRREEEQRRRNQGGR